MSEKKYTTWRQSSDEGNNLTDQFKLFDSTNGAEGINPKIDSTEIKQLYERTPELHKYNPRYFRQNFKNLVAVHELNKSLNNGRRK